MLSNSEKNVTPLMIHASTKEPKYDTEFNYLQEYMQINFTVENQLIQLTFLELFLNESLPLGPQCNGNPYIVGDYIYGLSEAMVF